MKLAIGTAQFGLNYGISNIMGQTTRQEANAIINYAVKNGITCIDTAREYAESENVLGEIIKNSNLNNVLRLITKVSKNSDILQDIGKSLNALGVSEVYGLLVHNTKCLLNNGGDEIYDRLVDTKNNGFVKKIGVSVYTPEEAERIIKQFDIDIIQFPCSILDQRFPQSGILDRLKAKKIEIHVRSVFLQGLCFMSPNNIPEYFKPIEDKIIAIDNTARELGVSKLKFLIEYVKSIGTIDNIVVGVNNLDQMKDVVNAYNEMSRDTIINYEQFAIFDDNFVNISKWRVK